MSRSISATAAAPPIDATATSRSTPPDFETAQRALFNAVGLEVRSRFVDLDAPSVRTHLFEAGPPDGERTRLFVHGGGSFGAFLAPLVARLVDERVVGFDRPGYGLSGPFDYDRRTLAGVDVATLDGVVDALGVERVDLVGHSMGGYASVRYALARPDRVRRLVLIGACAAFPGTWPPLPLRLLTVPVVSRVLQRLQPSGEAGALAVAEVFGERDAVAANPAVLQAMVAHEADPVSSAAGLSELGAFFSLRGWHPSVELRPADLQRLEPPSLLVWGEDDPIAAPDDIREGVADIPDARLEVVPGAHAPFLTHPARCAGLVGDFLDV